MGEPSRRRAAPRPPRHVAPARYAGRGVTGRYVGTRQLFSDRAAHRPPWGRVAVAPKVAPHRCGAATVRPEATFRQCTLNTQQILRITYNFAPTWILIPDIYTVRTREDACTRYVQLLMLRTLCTCCVLFLLVILWRKILGT